MSSPLNDVQGLNARFGLTDPKLVEFHPALVSMMTPRATDKVFFDHVDNFPSILDGYSRMGPAYCAVLHGKPLAVFGCIPLWRGVGECWLVTDEGLPRIARPFHRVTKEMFRLFMSELCLFRLQVTVHSGNRLAVKWIERLYFKREGRLRSFGPDGEDFFMYARIDDGRPLLGAESAAAPSRA